jgi:hypothetical protein
VDDELSQVVPVENAVLEPFDRAHCRDFPGHRLAVGADDVDLWIA